MNFKNSNAVPDIEKDVDWVRRTAKKYSSDVNCFGFKPVIYVDLGMDGDEYKTFVEISRVFVSLMARKPYTDGRNEEAKKRCCKYIEIRHPAFASFAEKEVRPGKPLYDMYLSNSEYDIAFFLNGLPEKCEPCSKEEAVAMLMYHDHPTLQQTFTQACLYALMKREGETDLIVDGFYVLPFI